MHSRMVAASATLDHIGFLEGSLRSPDGANMGSYLWLVDFIVVRLSQV